ncbi:MAG: hypothetical protein R2932_17315 [Caldilineaceae bacterium]
MQTINQTLTSYIQHSFKPAGAPPDHATASPTRPSAPTWPGHDSHGVITVQYLKNDEDSLR